MASRTRRTVYRACWPWTSSSTRRGWRSGWIGSEAGPEGEPTQSRGEASGGSGHGRDFPGAAQYPPPYRGHGRSHSLVPAVEVRPERLALLADHAETVAAGRFHHPPGVDLLDLFRAQRHEALDFGVDIVGFDVQVDARGVVDLLQQQDRLVAFGGQTRVLAVAVDRKSTRLNSSHVKISYAVFCLKKKNYDQSVRVMHRKNKLLQFAIK